MAVTRAAAASSQLSVGDLGRLLTVRLAQARTDLRQAQAVAQAELTAIQARIDQLEAAQVALTTDKEAFILQLQATGIL